MDENLVFYICNRKRCEDCSEECQYTTDIEYAANFEKIDDVGYWEKGEE